MRNFPHPKTHRNEDIAFLTEISLNKSHILTNNYLHGWYFLYISSILLIIPKRIRARRGQQSFGVHSGPLWRLTVPKASHQHHFHICTWFLLPTNSSTSVLSKTVWMSRRVRVIFMLVLLFILLNFQSYSETSHLCQLWFTCAHTHTNSEHTLTWSHHILSTIQFRKSRIEQNLKIKDEGIFLRLHI